MAITLPTASTANTDSTTTHTDSVAAAQAAFVASATVLINTAISNGLFAVQPYLPPLVTSDYVTTYFAAQGYVVTFPLTPPGPWNPCFPPAGFPEVIPPGWTNWGCGCGYTGLPRIQISWAST